MNESLKKEVQEQDGEIKSEKIFLVKLPDLPLDPDADADADAAADSLDQESLTSLQPNRREPSPGTKPLYVNIEARHMEYF